MFKKHVFHFFVALYMAFSLISCGPSPEDVAKEFAEGLEFGQYGKMYELLNASLRQKVSKEDYIKWAFQDIGGDEDATSISVKFVGKAEIEGSKANIKVILTITNPLLNQPIEKKDTLYLVKEKSGWKVDFGKELECAKAVANERNNKGIEYFNAKNYDAAIKEFTTASKADPENAVYLKNIGNAHSHLGVTYFNAKNYDAAIKEFTTASKVYPEEPSYFEWLGKVYNELNQPTKAKEAFEAAESLKK